MKYRKKPVVIEAARVELLLLNAKENRDELPDWFRHAHRDGTVLLRSQSISIRTPEGTMTGEIDDWIIQGVKGELYPCKPDIFAATYEPVS